MGELRKARGHIFVRRKLQTKGGLIEKVYVRRNNNRVEYHTPDMRCMICHLDELYVSSPWIRILAALAADVIETFRFLFE